ncbi:hypothetical protein C8Q77DRAFT_1045940 [Trametes polyzona]|nr:hypothetical protein C8Q77DRAFT_1045940 [Trametes polyzona]
MSHRPHPILKRDSSPFRTPTLPFSTCGPLFSPHVHFPPTPRLVAGTYPAHSPTTYDRAPIAVTPNVCQLPRRGERTVRTPPADSEGDRHRGRSRTRGTKRGGENVKGSYFHPRAYEACMPEPASMSSPAFDLPSTPPLVQDLSPSDESDSTVTTPPDPNVSAAIASCPIPLPLSSAPAERATRRSRNTPADKADFGSPPPPAMRARPGRRPNLVRKETRLQVESSRRTLSFTPDMDEGCLGGF